MSHLPIAVQYASIIFFAAAGISILLQLVIRTIGVPVHLPPRLGSLLAYKPMCEEPKPYRPIPALRLWGSILLMFGATRLLIFGSVYAYAASTGARQPTLFQTFASNWNLYDSLHYLGIAEFGYRTEGFERLSIVFYPFYPLLIRVFRYVIPDFFLAGVVVSNLFLLLGLYVLVRLVELEWRNSEAAIAAARYLLLFPFSFFFSIVYTESVFVTLGILSFYYLRRQKWLAAGLFAMLAAFTRNQGVLLAVPILVEAAASIDWRRLPEGAGRFLRSSKLMVKSAAVAMPAAGLFGYLLVNKLVTGDWFRFLLYQREHWKQEFGFFAKNLNDHVFRTLYYHTPNFAMGIWIPQVALFFVVCCLLVYMSNKVRLSYSLYSFAYFVVSYAPTGLLSGARYVSGMFTLYLFLACAVLKLPATARHCVEWTMVFSLLFYSVMFALKNVF